VVFNIIILIISYSILFIETVRSVVFSPNGEYLATGSSDGTVNLIETSKFEKIVHTFDK
jgi:WD40 repeat protein